MAVRIGNSYVSQQAYDYARAKVNGENSQGGEKNSVLQELSKQYPETTFAIGTQPFCGKGTNNISISSGILKKMENDPEARIEYEALIYDCANLLKNEPTKHGNSTTIARGFIIDENGDLSMWGISQTDGGEKKKTNCKVEKNELRERLEKIRSKRTEEKKKLEKLKEKKADEKEKEEKAAEKKIDEKVMKKLETQTIDLKV